MSSLQATTHNRAEAADPVSAVAQTMSKDPEVSFLRRNRMPIILGIVAVCLYLGSIVWMVYGRGQVG